MTESTLIPATSTIFTSTEYFVPRTMRSRSRQRGSQHTQRNLNLNLCIEHPQAPTFSPRHMWLPGHCFRLFKSESLKVTFDLPLLARRQMVEQWQQFSKRPAGLLPNGKTRSYAFQLRLAFQGCRRVQNGACWRLLLVWEETLKLLSNLNM